MASQAEKKEFLCRCSYLEIYSACGPPLWARAPSPPPRPHPPHTPNPHRPCPASDEEIFDLLAPKKPKPGEESESLTLHENPEQGVYVKDLTMITVDSVASIDKVMMAGNKLRCVVAHQRCS